MTFYAYIGNVHAVCLCYVMSGMNYHFRLHFEVKCGLGHEVFLAIGKLKS